MPLYEYVCNDCHKEFSVHLTIKDYESNPNIKCPYCESGNVLKKFSAFYAKTDSKA